jgi:predicted Ser/Thr protein kinase
VTTTPTELVVRLSHVGVLGRVVRAALRHGTTRLPFDLVHEMPEEAVFHFEVTGFDKKVSVMGERAGEQAAGMVPYRFRPRSRVQAAELYLISEQLDVPAESDSVPPPEDAVPGRMESIPVAVSLPPPEDTVVDRCFIAGIRESVPPMHAPAAGVHVAPSGVRPAQQSPGSAPPPAARFPPPPAADPLLSRTIAGKYKLEALLGEGGAGAVYRAMHTDLGREVAVKVLHVQNQHEAQFVKRFKAEARAASRLDHRNVTRVLDFGQEPDGLLYLVMEYVAGRSLEAILQTEGRLPVLRVVEIGIQVASALAVAHNEGIIHRDIKPENLLLVPTIDEDFGPTDLVKVCDFGMAKLKNTGGEEELTIGGMICGSPAYMSPEQIRGGTLDARTDIYALGMTMYEAATGAHPFTAESLVELFMKHENEPPRKPSEFVPAIDALFEDILMRALAKRPQDRHESARTLRIELREAADELRDQPPPSSLAGSGR